MAINVAAQRSETDRYREEMLRGQNALRARHHAPALTADPELESYAQRWADHLAATGNFEHSRGPYGENLYYVESTSGLDSVEAARQAVRDWGSEAAKYRYGSGFSSTTGHFTQMVWVETKRLGCAMSRKGADQVYVVCSYDPPGNVQGEFPGNVLP